MAKRSRSKGPYVFGVKTFRTQTEAEQYIRSILYKYVPGETLAEDDAGFIQELLKHHHRAAEKNGAGVTAIKVAQDTPWGTRHFVAERRDGSSTDFSFMKCLYPLSALQRFKKACRDLVAEQVIAFRDRAFAEAEAHGQLRCPVLGMPMTEAEAHVDHEPPLTFERLVEEFIAEERLDVDRVALTGHGDGEVRKGFADQALEARWRAFHREHARLRVVSAAANLSAVKKQAA